MGADHADLQRERLASGLALGQAVVLNPMRIALEPDRLSDRTQPGRHDDGKIIKGGAQRLADQLQEVQVVDRTQNMGAEGRAACRAP